jgi:small multidrug resistance pump
MRIDSSRNDAWSRRASSHPTSGEASLWEVRWLQVAGIYNLAWGAVVMAWPHWWFDVSGAERLNFPEIWQCVGMIVGVYGIGYLAAATDPHHHWPIVLVGLLGKILGPVGFLNSLANGRFPLLFGATILTNDLLWWIPFSLILWRSWKSRVARQNLVSSTNLCHSSAEFRTSIGKHS